MNCICFISHPLLLPALHLVCFKRDFLFLSYRAVRVHKHTHTHTRPADSLVNSCSQSACFIHRLALELQCKQSKLPSISLCKVCRAKQARDHSANFPSCIWPSLYHQMKASTNVLDITEQFFLLRHWTDFQPFVFHRMCLIPLPRVKSKPNPLYANSDRRPHMVVSFQVSLPNPS